MSSLRGDIDLGWNGLAIAPIDDEHVGLTGGRLRGVTRPSALSASGCSRHSQVDESVGTWKNTDIHESELR